MTPAFENLVLGVISSGIYAFLVYLIIRFNQHRLGRSEILDIRRRILELQPYYDSFVYTKGVFKALADTLPMVADELAEFGAEAFTTELTRDLAFKLKRCLLNVDHLDSWQRAIGLHIAGLEGHLRYLSERKQTAVRRFLHLATNAGVMLTFKAETVRRSVRILDVALDYLRGQQELQDMVGHSDVRIAVAANFNRTLPEYLRNALCSTFEDCVHFAHLFAQWVNCHDRLFAPLEEVDAGLSNLPFRTRLEPPSFDWNKLRVDRIEGYHVDPPPDLLVARLSAEPSA